MFSKNISPIKIPSIFELPLPNTINTLFDQNYLLKFEPVIDKDKNQNMKGMWSEEEDNLLKEAIKNSLDPISWEEVSKIVSGRTPKQCRERWLFRLSPDVNKAPFQKWEDELIVIERQKIGNHWTAIASKLPGRTSCAVKNRWYTVLRNRVKLPNNSKKTVSTFNMISNYY